MVAGSPEEQAAIAGGQASLARINQINAAKQTPAAGNDFNHMAMTDQFGKIITAPPTPPAAGNDFRAAVMGPDDYARLGIPPPPDRADVPAKLLNMGGIASLRSGGYPRRTGQISGPGTATSDSIPAMLSDGEFVMTAKAVRGAGKGDKRAGAKRMYALMNQLEKNAARG
jgi:hypothetical protein